MDRPIKKQEDPELNEVKPAPAETNPQKTKEEWEAIIAEAQARKAKLEEVTPTMPPPPTMTTPETPMPAPPIVDEVVESPVVPEASKVEQDPSIPEETPKPEKEVYNASSMIFTDIGTDEELRDLYTKLDEEDTRPQDIKDENPLDAIVDLGLCETIGLRSKQQRLLTDILKELEKTNNNVAKLAKGVKELGLSKIKPSTYALDGPKVLSGDAALATVIARTKGVFRIPLYNSGFWVSVKPPTLSEMDSFIREVDIEFREFGKILGAHYHLIFGVFIKQKLMDILVNNLINSNFDNFKNRTALMSAISLHDYDTIAWAFCSMMHSDGISMGLYCTNIDCGHKDTSQYLDLAKCNYLNHDILTKEAIAWMLEGFNPRVVRTIEDINNYKTNLLKTSRTFKDTSGDNIYTLEVPSMERYFSIGTELLHSIIDSVHGEINVNDELLAGQITYNVYKMLTPWVSKLTMYDQGVARFITSDSKAIMESLDIGYGEDSKIYDEIEKFIGETRVSYFGATTLKCPKCGKVPDFTQDNMFLFDMEQLFFGLSYLRLGRIGERT